MKKAFTISVFAEYNLSTINRINLVFSRCQIKIDSFKTTQTNVSDVYYYEIKLSSNPETINKLVGQIEKIIEVLKVIVHKEIPLEKPEIAFFETRSNTFSYL